MSTTFWIIIAAAFATYATRAGGHIVLSRFDSIHPRVEAGLNAVPAAVLTTIIAPVIVDPDPAELLALVVAAAVSLRWSTTTMFFAGVATAVVVRLLT